MGCYSANCTAWAQDDCRLDESSGSYFASVGFCTYSVARSSAPCDEMCTSPLTFCKASVPLTEGHHVLWYGTQRVDFDVPSAFYPRSVCTEQVEVP